MKRVYHLHADDVTAEVYPKTPPPGGVTFKVYEVLARDPETNFGRWCSAQVQQTAELIRYEVEVDYTGLDMDTEAEAQEWAGDLEIDLMAETEDTDIWYGSTTFDTWPHAVVEVEVDDEDLEGLDPTSFAFDKKLLDRLHEDESGYPTSVPRPNSKPAPAGAPEFQ